MRSSATIYIISDGTGETAATMVRAALVQYHEENIHIVRCKNVRTEEQVESFVDDAAQSQGFIVFTVVSPPLRKKIVEASAEKNVPSVDLLGPLLLRLDSYFGNTEIKMEAGLLHSVNEAYFKRIEAIEFTVKHDDGKTMRDLDQADIILVGISRTSKTPLSIFLSHKGWKVANVPLVLNVAPPAELFKVDQRKVVALTIDRNTLSKVRKERLERLGQDPGGEYASPSYIHQELDYSDELFKKNKRWPVFDVTQRALEETASEITKLICARFNIKEDLFL